MALRWLVALFAVFGAFVAAGVAGAMTAEQAGLWDIPGAGFCAAMAVVLVSYLAAPTHKMPFTIGVFLLGLVSAWLLLEPSSNPENYQNAYVGTHLPIVVTYAGGLLGLLAVTAHWIKSRAEA
jgi:hypothetical protein